MSKMGMSLKYLRTFVGGGVGTTGEFVGGGVGASVAIYLKGEADM
jgi:hypothetical protein